MRGWHYAFGYLVKGCTNKCFPFPGKANHATKERKESDSKAHLPIWGRFAFEFIKTWLANARNKSTEIQLNQTEECDGRKLGYNQKNTLAIKWGDGQGSQGGWDLERTGHQNTFHNFMYCFWLFWLPGFVLFLFEEEGQRVSNNITKLSTSPTTATITHPIHEKTDPLLIPQKDPCFSCPPWAKSCRRNEGRHPLLSQFTLAGELKLGTHRSSINQGEKTFPREGKVSGWRQCAEQTTDFCSKFKNRRPWISTWKQLTLNGDIWLYNEEKELALYPVTL